MAYSEVIRLAYSTKRKNRSDSDSIAGVKDEKWPTPEYSGWLIQLREKNCSFLIYLVDCVLEASESTLRYVLRSMYVVFVSVELYLLSYFYLFSFTSH